jgi:hypothetical protein
MGPLSRPRSGIHFDAGRVAVAEVEKHGSRIRLKSHEVAYLTDRVLIPDPLLPGIRDEELVQKTLRTMLKPSRRPKPVSVSLSDTVAKVTLIPMEKQITAPAEIEKLIRWKMEKDSIYPPKEARIRYQLLPSLILASSIHEKVILQYESVLRASGLETRLMDIASFHVFNLYHDHLLRRCGPQQNFIFLYAGDAFSTVMFFAGGILNFIRIKPIRAQARSVEDRIIEEMRSSLAFYLAYYKKGHDAASFTHLFTTGLSVSDAISKLSGEFPWETVHLKPEDVVAVSSQSTEIRTEDWPVLIPAIAAAAGR